MQYVSITNKPCRLFLYKNSKFESHSGMLKFNSLAQVYQFLNKNHCVYAQVKNAQPIDWYLINSLSTFRKYCKKHRQFRGFFYTDIFSNYDDICFFSLIQE